MASRPANLLLIFFAFQLLMHSSHGFNPKLFNVSGLHDDHGWSPAGATWYGSPNGGGSDGGACGYKDSVEQPPFSKMVSAGGPSLFQSGHGCGACYQVKCTNNQACSGNPATVTITDFCPECTQESAHFDLSGTAFGAMAKPGQADALRNAGKFTVEYKRVKCNPGVNMAIDVDSGSNPYYFSMAIKYVGGDGNLKSVELQQAGSGSWSSMQQNWGALWKLNSGSPLQAPFSLRLTQVQEKAWSSKMSYQEDGNPAKLTVPPPILSFRRHAGALLYMEYHAPHYCRHPYNRSSRKCCTIFNVN